MDDSRDWYYARDEAQQSGPVSLAELGQAIREGRCGARDLVWTEGMADWQPASTVPALAPLLARAPGPYAPAAAPAASAAGPPPAYVPAAPLPYAGPVPYGQRPPSHNGLAIAAFVCSIAALPMMCCSALVGIPLSIVGLVLGVIAKNGMERTGNFEGRGMAIAAIWIGIVTLALAALAITILVIAIVASHK